jgi:hypothetical protein
MGGQSKGNACGDGSRPVGRRAQEPIEASGWKTPASAVAILAIYGAEDVNGFISLFIAAVWERLRTSYRLLTATE